MARQLAKNAQIMISDTDSGEPDLLEALASWTYDKSKTEVDVTGVFDANKQYVPGQGDARGDFTVIVDPESETLEILETAQKASYSASVDGRVEAAVTFVAGGNVDSTAQASV